MSGKLNGSNGFEAGAGNGVGSVWKGKKRSVMKWREAVAEETARQRWKPTSRGAAGKGAETRPATAQPSC